MQRKLTKVRGNPELAANTVADALGMSVAQVKYALRMGRLKSLLLVDILEYQRNLYECAD